MRGYGALGFDAIEIKASFYHLPKTDTLAHWAEQAPASLRFALLAPARITHLQRLDGTELALRYFLRAARALGERCGPLLFQLPLGLTKDETRLARFLELLPHGTEAAFEFLDPSWHDEAIYERLRARNCALSLRDGEESGARSFAATADWGYLRLALLGRAAARRQRPNFQYVLVRANADRERVARAERLGRLRALAVDLHLPARHRLRGQHPRLEKARRPEPLVEAHAGTLAFHPIFRSSSFRSTGPAPSPAPEGTAGAVEITPAQADQPGSPRYR